MRTSAKRNATKAILFVLSLSACNDVFGFQEGKPFPDAASHVEASVPDGAATANPIDQSSPDVRDAQTADGQVDAGEAWAIP